jgi:hypothetical protein
MSSIKHLREALGLQDGDPPRHDDLFAHAADEIDRFRQQRDNLRKAARSILDALDSNPQRVLLEAAITAAGDA